MFKLSVVHSWFLLSQVLCCLTSYSTGSAIGLTPWIALGLAILLIAVVRLSAQFVALTSQRYWISESLYSFSMRWPQNVWTGVKTALLFACIATLSFRLSTYFEENIDHLESNDLTLPPSAAPLNPATASGGRIMDEIDSDADLHQVWNFNSFSLIKHLNLKFQSFPGNIIESTATILPHRRPRRRMPPHK